MRRFFKRFLKLWCLLALAFAGLTATALVARAMLLWFLAHTGPLEAPVVLAVLAITVLAAMFAPFTRD